MGLRGLLLISLLATTAAEHLALAVVGSDAFKRIKRNYDFERHPQDGGEDSYESNTVDYGKGARYSLNDVRPQSNGGNMEYPEPDYDEMQPQHYQRRPQYNRGRDQIQSHHLERKPHPQHHQGEESVQHSPPHHGGNDDYYSQPFSVVGHRPPENNHVSHPMHEGGNSYSRGGFRGMTHSEARPYGGGHRSMAHSGEGGRGHGSIAHLGGGGRGDGSMAHLRGGRGQGAMTHPRRGAYGGGSEFGVRSHSEENTYTIGGRDHPTVMHTTGNNYGGGRSQEVTPHSGGGGYGVDSGHRASHGGPSGQVHESMTYTGDNNHIDESAYGTIDPSVGGTYEGGSSQGAKTHGHGSPTHPTAYTSNAHMGGGIGHMGGGLYGMTGLDYGHSNNKKDVTAINAAAILAIQQVKALDRAASYSFSGGGNSYGR